MNGWMQRWMDVWKSLAMARRNKNRPNPLFEAIRADDLETVRFLIETQPERINAIAPKYPLGTRGMSPL